MAAMLPKIDFLSIALRGGKDLYKKSDNPYIQQGGETVLLSYGVTSTKDNISDAPEPMNVDIISIVQVPFSTSINDTYSYFFEDEFTKYLKIKVVQSTDPSISSQMSANAFSWIKPGGLLEQNQSAAVSVITKQLTEFEGSDPAFSEQFANSIEVKTANNGNKVYCFPYKFTFEVKENQGGIKAEHLTYFAFAYIDLESMAQDQQMPLMQNQSYQSMAFGQANKMSVIQGGTTKNSNQIFYVTPTSQSGNPIPFPNLFDNDGNIIGKDYSEATVWTGAVHYHDAQNPGPNGYIGYMAGQAGADMGPFLTATTVYNGTIQDFRKYPDIEKISFDYSLFSNSWFNLKTAQAFQSNMNGLMNTEYFDNPYTSQDIEEYLIKSSTNSSNQSIFGEMYTGMDGSGNTRFAFSFNIREAIKQNTAFPALAQYLFQHGTQADLEQILNKKLIKDFKIYRHRVHKENPASLTVDKYEYVENEDPKLVVNTVENPSGVLIPKVEKDPESLNDIGAVKEVSVDLPLVDYDSSSIKFYTGTDLNTPVDGDYVFSIEIIMNDPIVPWVKNKINILEQVLYEQGALHSYNDYVKDCTRNTDFFNLYTNRFTEAGINFLEQKYGAAFSHNKINLFANTLFSFLITDTKSISELFSFLNIISSLEYGNPTGVQTAFKAMETIYGKILNTYSSIAKYKKSLDSKHTESQYSAGSNPLRQYAIRHKFDTEIKGQTNHLTGYDYLSLFNTAEEDTQIFDGLKNLSVTEYEQRTSLETLKLFPPAKEQQQQSLNIAFKNQVLNPNDYLGFTKYAYLSPSVVNFAGASSKNLLNDGSMNTNIAEVNNIMLNAVRKNLRDNQDYDFPTTATSTGIKSTSPDAIVKPNENSEMKYDISSLMALNQVSIKTKDKKEIIDSSTDPTSLLLTALQQKYFNSLSDASWAWESYVDLSKMQKEYMMWQQKSQSLSDKYESSNSPLKRAPNHIKALLIQLNHHQEGNSNIAPFEYLKSYLENAKPEAYEYDIPQQQTEPKEASNFLGVQRVDGSTKIVPKNKVIYQTPEFLAFFLLNFKRIVKVECLLGYNSDNINDPIWREMSFDVFDTLYRRSGNVICRMVSYEKELYGVKGYGFLDLPTYNKHFIINFGLKDASVGNIPVANGERDIETEVYVRGEARVIYANPNQQNGPRAIQGDVLPAYSSFRPDDDGEPQEVGILDSPESVSAGNQNNTSFTPQSQGGGTTQSGGMTTVSSGTQY